jgi:hypothetical protein
MIKQRVIKREPDLGKNWETSDNHNFSMANQKEGGVGNELHVNIIFSSKRSEFEFRHIDKGPGKWIVGLDNWQRSGEGIIQSNWGLKRKEGGVRQREIRERTSERIWRRDSMKSKV